MTLHQLLPETRGVLAEREIGTITDDTRKVTAGDIFVAIKGKHFDGHSVAADMLIKGAALVVTEQSLGLERELTVGNTRAFYSEMASRYYGRPTRSLTLVGVTGTNGKSTFVTLLRHILSENGIKCGSIGTISVNTGEKEYEARLTTPEPMELYRYFREMADSGATHCAIEASSQALSQHRLANERFHTAVFTNLTQDHLDWHGTMNEYFLAKRSLFDMCDNAVLNTDDKYGRNIADYLADKNVTTVACSNKKQRGYFAADITSCGAAMKFTLTSEQEQRSYPVTLPLPGEYNVSNAVLAVAAAVTLGVTAQNAADALLSLKGVPGRSEVLYNEKFTVIRDYAHTEDALIKFISSVKPTTTGKVILVFGAAGERDKGKRAAMGRTAAHLADFSVVTSDNPRFENEDDIIAEVAVGLDEAGGKYTRERDRRKAIQFALSVATDGDLVLLCGKGHETYQVIGADYLPFDEKEIVKNLIWGVGGEVPI
ncbi:MAG: UDP-N-acetylmuramoyl-L-alanyl-D-glutamate--2,6-diaminopimelate ligase [Oscillospiraceae bacterium]|jgi:UDP-N-acetylmuramoyl-L-alanyl-D-glutamate--2,6-diaminopimelate ligase|nr:UDP-N-acetylmuramoyl-L-alanyl-D-glutamate--2,6-diaminopimelate ligase [Oscillospiraceae bacterium]